MRTMYSVAQARMRLPRLLQEVEGGRTVGITRRGKPVAVVLSVSAYRALAGSRGGFRAAYRAWRASVDAADLDLPRDYFDRLRDRSPGRRVRV